MTRIAENYLLGFLLRDWRCDTPCWYTHVQIERRFIVEWPQKRRETE